MKDSPKGNIPGYHFVDLLKIKIKRIDLSGKRKMHMVCALACALKNSRKMTGRFISPFSENHFNTVATANKTKPTQCTYIVDGRNFIRIKDNAILLCFVFFTKTPR